MIEKAVYAQLASRAYAATQLNRTPVPADWVEIEWVPDRANGFSAGVYRNVGSNEIVIAYTGTNGDKVTDFGWANLLLGTGVLPSPQVTEAMLLYFSVKAANPSAAISFTGHSLGGGMATMMSIFFNRPATVFDAAPFEIGARSIFALPWYKAITAAAGYSDPEFDAYWGALPNVFISRESQAKNYFLKGEVLEILRLPETAIGTSISLDVGAPTGVTSTNELHSMKLLAAMVTSSPFEDAIRSTPWLMSMLFDKSLYAADTEIANRRDFLAALYGAQVKPIGPEPLLDRFGTDVLMIEGAAGAAGQSAMQQALAVAAMEYYYFNAPSETSALFNTSANGIHFNYADIGTGQAELKSPPLLAESMKPFLSSDEWAAAGYKLATQSAWHIQSGAEGMTWTASAAAYDVAVGGASTDVLDGGVGDDILIGGAGADFLSGGADNDILIGGLALDVLDGGTGNDRLFGGAGADVYRFSGAFGSDAVEDSDGAGVLELIGVGNVSGTGAKKTNPTATTWQTDDKDYTYSLVQVDAGQRNLVITVAAGANTGTITVRNWVDGQFGITLGADVLAPQTSASYSGDFGKQSSGGTYTVSDGNYTGSVFLPDAPDVITGAASADSLQGLGGNDALAGGAGDDFIEGGAGDDLLLGGSGADTLNGGAGNDFIFGSGAGALSTPTSTSFTPPVATGPEYARGFSWVVYDGGTDGNGFQLIQVAGADPTTLTNDEGNLIDSSAGNDFVFAGSGADVVHGGDDHDTISGLGGADVLFGDAGDDKIFGDGIALAGYSASVAAAEHGSDILVGGAGNDVLVGQGGDDELYGGTEDDQLFGDDSNPLSTPYAIHGNDYLDGGDGADELSGGGKDDVLFGGIGNDSLWGDASLANLDGQYHGQDYLDGEEGDDYLEGGGQDDTLFGGSGNDNLWGDASIPGLTSAQYGADYLDGEAGDDNLVGGGGADTLFGGEGADFLLGDGDEVTLAADEGDDYLDGGAGNDILYGNGGNDTLLGGAGDDTLNGGDGNDTLDGGAGTDYMAGGMGDDTYVIAAGSSPLDALGRSETINDNEGRNIFALDGATSSTTQVTGDGAGNLILTYSATDQLVIANGAAGSGNSYQFSDGRSFSYSQLVGQLNDTAMQALDSAGYQHMLGGRLSDTISAGTPGATFSGGRGNDTLSGSGGRNTYLYSLGDGSDTVTDTSAKVDAQGNATPNRLVLGEGILVSDLRLTGAAGALRLQVGLDAADSITLGAFDASAGLQTAPIDTFEFFDGTTLSYAELVARGFDGAEGNDTVSGTAGDDRIAGHAGDDLLLGQTGNDTLDGGAGNDTLVGGLGNDTYLFGLGAGVDLIDNTDNGPGKMDTLRIGAGLSPVDVALTRVGVDLVVKLRGSTDQVTVQNHFSGAAINRVEFEGGPVWDDAAIASHVTNELTSGADNFFGTAGGDVILALAGNDIVQALGGDDYVDGGPGQDFLDVGEGNDWLIGGADADQLAGRAGDDTLDGRGDNAADSLYGGVGSDVYLFGRGSGVDTIDDQGASSDVDVLRLDVGLTPQDLKFSVIGSMIGVGIIGTGDQARFWNPDVYGAANRIERIQFGDGTVWNEAQWLARVFADQATSGNDNINGFNTTDDLLVGADSYSNDTFHGKGGNDTLDGRLGYHYLFGDAGDDTLIDGGTADGGTGNDTYVLTGTRGAVIQAADAASASGLDTLLLPTGLLPSQLVLDRGFNASTGGYDDLILSRNTGGAQLALVRRFFAVAQGTDNVIDAIRFDDGTIWSTADIFARVGGQTATEGADTLLGFAGDDTMSGLGGDDTLYGGSGNDTLDGGPGQDRLEGGLGADTYRFGLGSGKDVIVEAGGSTDEVDTVQLGAGLVPGDVALVRDGQDLVLILRSSSTQLRVQGHFNPFNSSTGLPGDNRIERITFAGGGAWDAAQIAGLTASGAVNALTGTAANDVFQVDNALDTVSEGVNAGIDTVVSAVSYALPSNVENLTVTGVLNARLVGNELDNVLTGNAGDNTFVSSTGYTGGTDTLIGGAGDDVYDYQSPYSAALIVENPGEGYDTWISRGGTLPANVEVLIDTYFDGTYYNMGQPIGRALTGNAADNVITVAGGATGYWSASAIRTNVGTAITIDGGAGADTMNGSHDDTAYVVDNPGDVVNETSTVSYDTVRSSIGYTLGANLEALVLTGSASIAGFGNALNNRLDGTQSSGSNTLAGGLGDDIYVLGAADVALEQPGEGFDTVILSNAPAAGSTFRLTEFANVEGLTVAATLSGGFSIEGTAGNDALSYLGSTYRPDLFAYIGGTVSAGAGDDVLIGGDGRDTLDGGAGIDLMQGGGGDDVYVVDNVMDLVVEGSDSRSGIDEIRSSVSYALPENIERIVLTGANDIDAVGNAGANYLEGNAGRNVLTGGAGDDRYVVSSAAHTTVEVAGGGFDTVESSVDWTLSEEVESLVLTGAAALTGRGNAGANTLFGNAGASVLDGGLGDDVLYGGAGNDRYEYRLGDGNDTIWDDEGLADSVAMGTGIAAADVRVALQDPASGTPDYTLELAGNGNVLWISGIELVTFADGTVWDAAQLSGLARTVYGTPGDDTLVGTAGNDVLRGLGGSDWLSGNAGDDELDGGAGNDTMVGGTGNDTYLVDSSADVVTEGASAGTDTVQSAVSYTLGTNVENLTLIGTLPLNGTGNTLANALRGNGAANTLNGGTGADSMFGGAGDDTYVVDNASDVVTELADEGTDIVQSSLTWTLAGHVENLTLTGTSAINGTGNALANVLTGNSGANVLNGGAGNDTLVGGAGNDTYVVDSEADLVVEAAAGGTDLVQSAVTWTLGANVENLTLTGTAAINGTGNELNNSLTGNTAANILDGGLGNDTMVGGSGDDFYVVDSTADVMTEAASAGTDTVMSSVTLTLAANVENLSLTGAAAINGTGNTLNNVLRGNAANNTLSGGTGSDSMSGGAGNDTYVVDVAGDAVVELLAEGIDLVQSAVTYALAANVENLTLTGTTSINGTGNTLDNLLTGNSANNTLTGGAGNDTLDGGTGNDTMLGGTGDDTYVVNVATDVVTELANEGTDTVRSGVTLTLGATVENLVLTGTTALNGTGNALDNVLTGNSAANTLTGGAGNDTLDGGAGTDSLVGGAGNDTLVVDATTDVTTEAANEGTDTVRSSVTWTLGTNLENLTLLGTTAINGTGNASNNVLTGNAGANTLTGAAGNDTVDGAAGNDVLVGGAGADSYAFGRGWGLDTIQENDATAGVVDQVVLGSGIAQADTSFFRVGNNLEVSILGTTDKLVVQSWYLGGQYQVEQFRYADGTTITNSQVAGLLSAMASFGAAAAAETAPKVRTTQWKHPEYAVASA